jgi:Zn-dependent peptidase ImmA (M78 family)
MAANQLSLPPARRAVIDDAVKRLHEQLRYAAPPFPFEEFFAADPSYHVIEADLPAGLDGTLVIADEGSKLIRLRRDNPRPRVRFTLAHEIIHAELHFHEGKLCDNQACRTSDRFRDGERSPDEREADYGAAALLMPLWMLERYAPRGPVPDDELRRLARLFRVSERTMRIQLELLGAE